MSNRDKQAQKEYNKAYYQKNKDKILDHKKEYKKQNDKKVKESSKKKNTKILIKLNENAIKSLLNGYIIDITLWSKWMSFKNSKYNDIVYEISDNEAFDLMEKKCYYCGDFAMTLDRLDSNKSHTAANCVGCCDFCNRSKGSVDPKSFILQAVYRRTFVYYEDSDIWTFSYKNEKPKISLYKNHAERQNRKFELTKEQFDTLVVGQCRYCRRQPTKYFGIDKIFPDKGYTTSNCVTACANCNWSKWDATIDQFTLRDERITQRYLAGYFDDMPSIPKNTSYRRKK